MSVFVPPSTKYICAPKPACLGIYSLDLLISISSPPYSSAMASIMRVERRCVSSARSGPVSCSDQISKATKKVATWPPVPGITLPRAVSNSILTASLPSTYPHTQRHVVDLGTRVVLVQVALDGHTMDRRIAGVVDPAVQCPPHSLGHRPYLAPRFRPAGELHQRHRRPETALVRRQPPIAHPLVRDSGQRRFRAFVWPAAYGESPGADQGGHLRRGQQALADQNFDL